MTATTKTKNTYTEWLPTSNYDHASIIDDFEFYDGKSTKKKNPEIDLYVAIMFKGIMTNCG